MKPKNRIYAIVLSLLSIVVQAQQSIEMNVKIEPETKTLLIEQHIRYKNNTPKTIDKLIFNDWNHSYSNRQTKLGKRFSNQFVRNFHLATLAERGQTTINSFKIDQKEIDWNRKSDQIDLIEIKTAGLQPNDSIAIIINYQLRIPDSKFTRWGYDKGNFYLKDFFIMMAKNHPNAEISYSNEDLEDAYLEDIKDIKIEFSTNKDYSIQSNLTEIAKNTFKGVNNKEIEFAIEKKSSFENFSTNAMDIVTNLESTKINTLDKALIIDRIVNYLNKNLGKGKTNKILISQIDYERNPFYGLNQLPSFLSPFSNNFLYELKFLKVYTQNYLKYNLNIDFRKDHFLLDAIQSYVLYKYIEEFYPDLHLIGSLSKYRLIKSYEISKANFNDQYYLAYLLSARKNIDQPLTESKEKLIKFNEQIATRYKSGLTLKFLENYLNDQSIANSLMGYMALNENQSTDLNDFERILKQNSSKNIDWFFEELLPTNKTVDYTFSKTVRNKNQVAVTIKNKNHSQIPYQITGFKNREKVFTNWFSPKVDTTLIFSKKEIDRVAINYDNLFPEADKTNNFENIKHQFGFNRPLKFTFYQDIENQKTNQIFFYPEYAFNVYDGSVISMTFNNTGLINKVFNYDFSPSYSTRTQSLTGSGYFSYILNKQNVANFQTRFSISGSYFHYLPNASYTKITPAIVFRFRPKEIASNKYKFLSFREVIVSKQDSPFLTDKSIPLEYAVFDSRFGLGNSETAKSYRFSTNIQLGNTMGKWVNEGGFHKLFENNYQIGMRFYTGLFLYNNSNTEYYSFGLDRPKDYLFDYSFYGRNETKGFFSQQIIIAEGGFKTKFANPYANQWLTSLNLTSSLWKWIQLYGDIGLYKNKNQSTQWVYDTGIHFNLVPGYFEVFCPIYSKNGWEIGQKNYNEKIRFQFTITTSALLGIFNRKWF